MLTSEKPRWGKVRVFGCDCFEHTPNSEYCKVPGIPRGRRLIFVGYGLDMGGWRCFDPEARRYFSTGSLYFNEDSSSLPDLTCNTRAPHFTPQHLLLCHMGLY